MCTSEKTESFPAVGCWSVLKADTMSERGFFLEYRLQLREEKERGEGGERRSSTAGLKTYVTVGSRPVKWESGGHIRILMLSFYRNLLIFIL